MQTQELSELLYLFSKIENLLDKQGATGTSLSDKVKSFDTFEKIELPEHMKDIGYKFYFKDNRYNIKDTYEYDDNIDEERELYQRFKFQKTAYYNYRERLLGGHFNNLIRIAHERNQLLHICQYDIDDYKAFIKACLSVINYLEQDGTKAFYSSIKLHPKEERPPVVFNPVGQLHLKDRNIFALIETLVGTILLLPYTLVKEHLLMLLIFLGLFFAGIHYDVQHYYTQKIPLNPYLILFIAAGITTIFLRYLGDMIAYVFDTFFAILGVLIRLIIPALKVGLFAYLIYIGYNLWIKKSDKTTSQKAQCTFYYVKTAGLNVRKNASSKAQVVGEVYPGKALCVTQKRGSWLFVNKKGWVYAKHMRLQNP